MATAAEAARPPFWRNVRVLRILGQVIFLALVAVALRELYLNLEFGVRRQGQDLSYEFLRSRAGFPIKEGISYSPNQPYLRAFLVGLVNTIRVAAVGIVLATLLGVVIGVLRLSPNWLLRKAAQIYVEVIRNTPVLIQIVFWYFAVVLTLPAIEGGFSLGGVFFLSNQGTAIPWPRAGPGAGIWGLFLLGGLVVAAVMWSWRTRANERTGRPHHRLSLSFAVFLALAGLGYAVAGDALRLDVPRVTGLIYAGGFRLSPEYTAVLLGLVIYTAAFIAEIVRGSILAVDKGQKEAGAALGLTPFQQLRHVVLPQAMRIAIPPINSQYLNLTKNSSLAVAVGYPELASVSSTMINQAGRAFQITVMVMATYLTMSLLISFVMNLANRAVAYRGVRR
ncbi:MAG TPA: ABC transporter permease subunit [Actinomycetota bacterium]|jgi:general L-amino acid transport system permease protein|nr:ABC transporter permease subunit [Actinomycetota bacterium]